MKAHELARKLLEGPDLPVVTTQGEMDDFYEVVIIRDLKNWPWRSFSDDLTTEPALVLQ